MTSTDRTAGCGPACPVVWQGRTGEIISVPPMPIDGDVVGDRAFNWHATVSIGLELW